jgi:hypothetical protein
MQNDYYVYPVSQNNIKDWPITWSQKYENKKLIHGFVYSNQSTRKDKLLIKGETKIIKLFHIDFMSAKMLLGL